ncbi:MAG: bifunctional UDP-N-acetylmuramoyl-tripeptide:D-alanyl-D-alanine ligase/alanine racemase [Bacteroidales bacterium]|nr:bifunctional UDP-N-acetylmuramoyl-tripeptide:D-alanyl-D-alanine ligase/alanine racemase [Bacteroidales bacterium]
MKDKSYSLDLLNTIVDGKIIRKSDQYNIITDLLIDSRKLVSVDGTLFFALVSKKNDGHKYIPELYGKGVRSFIVSKESELYNKLVDANFILVNNTLEALHQLCTFHRLQFNYPIIGITGSNGKTIIKEWLYQLLQADFSIIRSPKSYNSQIGVPLSVWQMNGSFNMGIFEAGISETDEMERLRKIIEPTIGIFSNIGQAHGENFISTLQKAGEKLKLFTKVDTLIYCHDYPEIRETVIKSEILRSIKVFTWSKQQEADLGITQITKLKSKKSEIYGIYKNKKESITIPFTDDASVENAIHCWALMLLLGYRQNVIRERMQSLQPIAMRLELKAGINHCSIVNDSYNSDINSLRIAIDFLDQQNHQKEKTVILSDILQSGRNESDLYSEIADLFVKKNIKKIIGIGEAISRQSERFKGNKSFYLRTSEFLKKHSFASFQNEIILLKGARVFEFEQISKTLQQRTHETVMEINLNALIHNLNHFRSKLLKTTRIMAMVKAYSYGSGSYEIANILQFHNIDYLAVAYADEGIELRKAGINVPIMIMNPDEQSFDSIIKHNLEPEIYNFRVLGILEKAIRKNILPANKPVKIHIKLDTGMKRLGFDPNDIEKLIKRIHCNKFIYLQSVFSHLAASENENEDDFTRRQIERFEEMAERIINAFDHQIFRHILNSAGIIRFQEAQMDMVRLGISLYGITSNESERPFLKNVNTLRSSISQIRIVGKDESVGYNRNWISQDERKIAIIPIGYADGLHRSLGNGKGKLFIGGQKVTIVGDICMDMCMADVTEINAGEGDEVIIFGNDYPISEVADAMGTIPYEILTSISHRVKRIYFQE